MKTSVLLSFLLSVCLLGGTQAQCNLDGGTVDKPFPDLMKFVADSYIMGVEYSVPGAKQIDYYTEYYEVEFKRGRVDSHQGGKKLQYLYRAENFEAWEIQGKRCDRFNITSTPSILKDDMTDWMHSRGTEQFTTIGPSAMFKIAFDDWSKKSKDKKMAYMGNFNDTVRGEKAVYYRRCFDENSYADYYFADQREEGALDEDVFGTNVTPLRVAFYNLTGKEKEMKNQFYDIISFRHHIPKELDPFQLPKGLGCTRDPKVDGPKMPDFSQNSFLLNAEVIYRKISSDDNEDISSYYSTLMLALDRQLQHMAYKYSSWNTTKPDKDHQEPFVNSPKYIIFDLMHNYTYKMNYERAMCSIARQNSFSPKYRLPENGGNVALDDPYVFFPNNEFTFLTKRIERGVEVNVFEAVVENYPLDLQNEKEGVVPKMIVTRSYRTDNEETENSVAVRNVLTQVEMHLFRKDNIEEILTFNVFGFTTRLSRRWNVFDISQCFKNEDDYLYITIGFEPETRFLPELEKRLATIEDNVINQITGQSELNAVRIPYVMSDVKNNFIFITLLILGKPPLMLDFTNVESDKTVDAKDDDIQGVSTFEVCATNCLETKSLCWGFSMCGNTCYYGTGDSTTVKDKKECTLYRRYTNDTYIQSKEVQANNILGVVASGEFLVEVRLDNGESVQLKATVGQITDPGADDDLFQKMGNFLNPRMRVLKAAYKLKKGSTIKNLGRLRYDECQKVCLDFKDCETISYCLIDSQCTISSKYGADLKADEIEENNLCNLLTRNYADHFDRSPGMFSALTGGTTVVAPTLEDCARACLKQNQFKCLSFDRCTGGDREGCHLYSVYNLKTGTSITNDSRDARCGHYARKYSTEFSRKDKTRILGGNFQTILNITLEECSQQCYDFPGGSCFGYDFCQDQEVYDTSCTLIDSDPSRLKSGFSPICNNYARSGEQYAPRPYTSGYAGGIGFLCFLIGGVVGALIVFAIAYFKVNRR